MAINQDVITKLFVVYYRENFGARKQVRVAFATKTACFRFANANLQLVEKVCIERIMQENLWNEFCQAPNSTR